MGNDKKVGNSNQGLTQQEALLRLAKYGLNSLGSSNKFVLIKNIVDQLTDFLVIILLIAGLLSSMLGDQKTAMVMYAIVFLNAAIGFAQQYRTERTLEALKDMLPHYSNVVRDNEQKEVLSQYLVPGDIVILQAGDSVPADGIILEQFSLKINESSLTGESKPQLKVAGANAIHPNLNRVFMGTSVLEGEAKILITATGIQTEFGKIAQKTKQTSEELSPLQKKLRQVGRTVAKIAVSIMIALIIYSIIHEKFILHHNVATNSFRDIFLFALALAASLVPEGLPATVSVALSLGANRLIKRKAIVRRLAAVETLGSTNVICTDKTGTLTIGRMSVVQILSAKNLQISEANVFDFRKDEMLSLNFTLCHNVHQDDTKLIGDSDEIAFWESAAQHGIDPIENMRKYEKLHEFSFSPVRKMMSVVVGFSGEKLLFSKGNPDIILNKCNLSPNEKEHCLHCVDEMASQGLRVFCFAHRAVSGNTYNIDTMEKNLVFDGLAGLSDDIHPEVPKAIEYCQKAGIRLVMITGDYKVTAEAIAKKIRLAGQNENFRLISGTELANMSDLELRENLLHPIVFFETDPSEKLRIVSTLQKMGMVVAVTGDGVNDSLALKKADIGVAMGKAGTDVAKEAADMILLDDNFATIVNAIKEGRVIWNNLKKFLFYVFSSNAGEFMAVFCGILFGLPAPLLAVQILSVDLGTDVLPSLALAADNQTKGVLSEKITRREDLLNSKVLWQLLIVGVVMGGGAALNFWIFNGRSFELNDRYFQATTVAWVTLVICQVVNVFEVRGGLNNFKETVFGNRYVLWSVLGEIMLMFLVAYWPPLQNLLGTRGLSALEWILVLLVGLVFLLVQEMSRNYTEKRKLSIAGAS